MVTSRGERSGMELLQGRFKVSYSHKIGEGAFACVYKGLDIESNHQVAVKMYNMDPGGNASVKVEDVISCMRPSIEVMKSIRQDTASFTGQMPKDAKAASPQASSRRNSFIATLIEEDVARSIQGTVEEARKIASNLDLAHCFVELLGHSQDTAGRPGVDLESEKVFIVTELGARSLADSLADLSEAGISFSLDQLRQLQWDLVSIVCALHAVGFVHLDIKPQNIVRASRCWKLIDFDGAVRTHTKVKHHRLITSPWYMAPELAAALNPTRQSSEAGDTLEVSRLMDVWSAGMCALEAVFLQPVLRPWYEEWMTSTGSEGKFLQWLGDYTKPVMDDSMCRAADSISADMSKLLQRMLTKDPSDRACIAECLVHAWFRPIRNSMWRAADKVMRKEHLKATEQKEEFWSPRLSSLRVPYGFDIRLSAQSLLSSGKQSPRLSARSSLSSSRQSPRLSAQSSLSPGRQSPRRGPASRLCTLM